MQYDLFESVEISQMNHRLCEMQTKQDKLRKGMFARHGELSKRIDVLDGMVEDLLQVIMSLQNINEVKPKNDKVIKPIFGELMEMSK